MTKANFKQLNESQIKFYLAKDNINAKRTKSGLYYHIVTEGTGTQATYNSNITISYIGYLINGTVFDKSENLEINMSDVLEGWKEGISLFREGGEGILIIPSYLAYGRTAYGSIPGGSVLIFDFSLSKVTF